MTRLLTISVRAGGLPADAWDRPTPGEAAAMRPTINGRVILKIKGSNHSTPHGRRGTPRATLSDITGEIFS